MSQVNKLDCCSSSFPKPFLSQTFPFPSFPFLLIFLYFLFSFSFFLTPFGFMLISIVHFISRNVQVMVFTHSNKPWNILKQWYVSYLHVARTFITLSQIPLLNVLILEVIWVSLTCMLNTYWCCHLIPLLNVVMLEVNI